MGARVTAGGIVFDPSGAVLLIQRGHPPRVGSWTLPGGHVEAGETPLAAAAREVAEETGLRVEPVRVVTVVDLASEGRSFEIHEVLCRLAADPGELRAGGDALDARWARPDELDALGVTSEVRRVLALAAAADRNE